MTQREPLEYYVSCVIKYGITTRISHAVYISPGWYISEYFMHVSTNAMELLLQFVLTFMSFCSKLPEIVF